eukprot:4996937-Pyramimonas_sp.AAC.1
MRWHDFIWLARWKVRPPIFENSPPDQLMRRGRQRVEPAMCCISAEKVVGTMDLSRRWLPIVAAAAGSTADGDSERMRAE